MRFDILTRNYSNQPEVVGLCVKERRVVESLCGKDRLVVVEIVVGGNLDRAGAIVELITLSILSNISFSISSNSSPTSSLQ